LRPAQAELSRRSPRIPVREEPNGISFSPLVSPRPPADAEIELPMPQMDEAMPGMEN